MTESDSNASSTTGARLEGPLPGDPFLTVGDLDLRTAGYVRQEWFLEGTAHAYTVSHERREDGRWQAARAARVPFSLAHYAYTCAAQSQSFSLYDPAKPVARLTCSTLAP